MPVSIEKQQKSCISDSLLTPWLLILCLLVSGCAHAPRFDNKESDARERENRSLITMGETSAYLASSYQQFLLPALPLWANFSTTAQCRRPAPITHLNFLALANQFNYSYEQSVQLQLNYNQQIAQWQKEHGPNVSLFVKDEELIFYRAKDQIDARQFPFKRPTLPLIALIWIDPILNDTSWLIPLKAKLSENLDALPVFLSMCLNSAEMDNWITQNFPNERSILIPAESFSVFTPTEKQMGTQFQLDLNAFFDLTKSRVQLYLPEKAPLPPELLGELTILRYQRDLTH